MYVRVLQMLNNNTTAMIDGHPMPLWLASLLFGGGTILFCLFFMICKKETDVVENDRVGVDA